MINLIPEASNLCDIFNQSEFHIEGFHNLEKNDLYFRWTDFHFKIKSNLKETKNISLILEVIEEKKFFIESKRQRVEKILKTGEYEIFIPIYIFEEVSFYITPHNNFENDSRANLGCKVKNISTVIEQQKFISILETNKKLQVNHLNNQNIDFNFYLNTDFESQGLNLNFLDLPSESNEILYNPCIFNFYDKKYLSCRVDEIYPNGSVLSNVSVFDYLNLTEIKLKIKKDFPEENLEDFRFLQFRDKLIGSCASCRNRDEDFYHQKWLIFNEEFKHENNLHPVYGKNKKTINENVGDEKNWTLFTCNDKLYFIYKIFPHTVVETDLQGQIKTEYITHNFFSWDYGKPRLTSNPILKDGFFYSFFHSHLNAMVNNQVQRVYFAGVYKFNSEPPFNITNISKKPFIWGNKSRDKNRKRSGNYLPYCVFPSGAIIDDNKLEISLGINDQEPALIEINSKDKINSLFDEL